MMAVYMLIFLFLICFFQFFYIVHTRKQTVLLLQDLRELNDGSAQKLFTRENKIFAEIYYEINSILSKTQKQLLRFKRADDANKQMLTNLSHDIRTPLASLIGYLEALNDNNTDDFEEYIQISYNKSLALKSLIDMLFEWCKLNSREYQYQIKSYDINEITREVIIDWLPLFDKKTISIKVDIPDEEWFVMLDKTAYKRIINNLIQNAVYHGQCSDIAVSIRKMEIHKTEEKLHKGEVNIDKTDEKIVVDIANNGNIIPPDKLQYIFNRLYKCDLSRSESGNGLGLAITKELVTALKGTIDVSSTVEDGTHFTILFSP
ncbi:MAG: HAMP domain-containing histidine kinase [Clostridiales bacterium]|nr:HAMP domain-containing histidine kinase [Clostridiales bacterium]